MTSDQCPVAMQWTWYVSAYKATAARAAVVHQSLVVAGAVADSVAPLLAVGAMGDLATGDWVMVHASGVLVVVFGSFSVTSVPFMGAMVGTVVSFIVVLLSMGTMAGASVSLLSISGASVSCFVALRTGSWEHQFHSCREAQWVPTCG
jgi:hypothetical protein